MLGMTTSLCKLTFFLLILPVMVKAEPSIGIGTEIKFPMNEAGIDFKPCSGRVQDSCAEFTKIDDSMSSKTCLFTIKNARVAKLATSQGARVLRISNIIERNGEGNATLVILGGAKLPIELTCSGTIKQGNVSNVIPSFPLTTKLLNGFKEFTLGNVNIESNKVPETEPSLRLQKAPDSGGTTI